MKTEGPRTDVENECERVLRTLPEWFGDEESLLEYAKSTSRLTTFVAKEGSRVIGFVSLQEHFEQAWEVNCIAVDSAHRGRGIGKALHAVAENWIVNKGAALLQVKTLAESHPSRAYAETRKFYIAMGYCPLEVFPSLWAEHLPVLQLVKALRSDA